MLLLSKLFMGFLNLVGPRGERGSSVVADCFCLLMPKSVLERVARLSCVASSNFANNFSVFVPSVFRVLAEATDLVFLWPGFRGSNDDLTLNFVSNSKPLPFTWYTSSSFGGFAFVFARVSTYFTVTILGNSLAESFMPLFFRYLFCADSFLTYFGFLAVPLSAFLLFLLFLLCAELSELLDSMSIFSFLFLRIGLDFAGGASPSFFKSIFGSLLAPPACVDMGCKLYVLYMPYIVSICKVDYLLLAFVALIFLVTRSCDFKLTIFSSSELLWNMSFTSFLTAIPLNASLSLFASRVVWCVT